MAAVQLPNPAVRPPGEPGLAAEPTGGRDLLKVPFLAAVARSRWYPGALQIPVAAGFGLVGYELLLGPSAAHDNLGTALMWVLWWPAIPLFFLFVGRLWCAVCPFGAVSDLVQKLVGLNRPVPTFLKKYGIWLIDASFLAITWSDHVFGVVESPLGSGVLLLLLTTAVIASGAMFSRRTFCRYLCFFGGMSGNYARTAMVSLRADASICATCTAKAACFNGRDDVPGCPMFNFPRTMEDNASCTLCATCIKACPNDAITLTLRKPTRELWFIRKPKIEESFLALAIMGIVLLQNVTMLGMWQTALTWVRSTTRITYYPVVFTLVFVVAIAAPVAVFAVASRLAAAPGLEDSKANFARFGYALIPLDLAAHIAHNLFHLLAEGKSVYYTFLGLFGAEQHPVSTALVSTTAIHVLQLTALALGAAASLYAIHRIALSRYSTTARRRSTARPFVAVVLGFTGLNAYLFMLPMAMRM